MKVQLYSYLHEGNGLSVEVLPETDAEDKLLSAMWKHGRLAVVHSSDNPRSTAGYVITAFRGSTEPATSSEAAGGNDSAT